MATSVVEMHNRSKVHPHKFALWVACGSILMMFAGLTSAYIVRQAAGNWLEFRLPDLFFLNTGVILLSSIALQASYVAFKNGNALRYRLLMVSGFSLGIGFLVIQYLGWQELMAIGVPLKTNPSGDFVYVISGLHAAHVVGGIGALVVALLHAFLLKFNPTNARKRRFELTLTYWHFVDFLWVYLLLFFVLQS